MKLTQRAIRSAIVVAVRVATAGAALLPWRIGVAMGGGIGCAAFYCLPRARRRALTHLTMALGSDTSDAERRTIARRSFANLGRSAFEVMMLSRRSRLRLQDFCRIEGESCLQDALSVGRGVIFVTGHVGNWELMAATIAMKGYPSWVVATPVYDSRLDELLVKARARQEVQTIRRGSSVAARQILTCLRSNGVLGMLIDQDTDVEGVFVPFFGQPAHTPSGAATLALKTEAVVIAGFIVRDGSYRHRIVLKGPLPLIRTGNVAHDVLANTAGFTRVIEDHVRKHPDEWVWMHNRWKRAQRDAERVPAPLATADAVGAEVP